MHQHLPDFIDIRTRLGEDGVVEVCHQSRPDKDVWLPATQSRGRADYYVHPTTNRITRYRFRRRKRYGKGRKREPTSYWVTEGTQLHRDTGGRWWLVTLAAIPTHCYHLDDRGRTYCDLPSPDVISGHNHLYDMSLLSGSYSREGVYGVRRATPSRALLERFGLA